ncbi:hypothetical protein BFF78_39680 [Streptomyces fodineus]|uniref:Uncharacterized protein n=1 Tax=Streptomyces fodineus TaxID=1904616 RepID=A0A1D7YPU4_9ACTN|nr:hypothetical protein BFF78_39680 [Streptomyces fodineus]
MDRIDRLDRMRRTGRPAQPERAGEPIYARLVAEWRAQGRAVPTGRPDVPWAVLPESARRARPPAERP